MFDLIDLSQWLGILQLLKVFAKPNQADSALRHWAQALQQFKWWKTDCCTSHGVPFLFPDLIERIQSWIFKGVVCEK